MSKCISRYTKDDTAQYFRDGRHKFYIEYRCNREVHEANQSICKSCSIKNVTKRQISRTYNHGTIYETIPDDSHIFGSKWYINASNKWGEPVKEVIDFAILSQQEARAEVPIVSVVPIRRKRPAIRSLPIEIPIQSIISENKTIIPIYIETSEEVSIDDYKIEYIRLSTFIFDSITYYKDKKNKLYECLKKSAIGKYIGRYDSQSETIDKTIPDSDDETS